MSFFTFFYLKKKKFLFEVRSLNLSVSNRNPSKSSSKKHINPTTTISVAFDGGSVRGIVPVSIVAATLNSCKLQNILIGYGSSPTLRFEEIVSMTPDTKSKSSLL